MPSDFDPKCHYLDSLEAISMDTENARDVFQTPRRREMQPLSVDLFTVRCNTAVLPFALQKASEQDLSEIYSQGIAHTEFACLACLTC